MNSHFTDEYANWAYDQENRYGGLLGPYRAVDLHCHTTCSDGIDSVEELVQKALARKLEFVAVTDHDYVNRTATQLLKANGIESCEAAEISARDYENKHSLHITFYAKHISDRTIKILDSVRTGRIEKVQQQCTKLAKNGFDISFTDLSSLATKQRMSVDSLSNSHIAQLLLSTQKNRARASEIIGAPVTTKSDIIINFLKDTSPHAEIGWVKIADYEPSVDLVAELARNDQAVTSIAHPNFSFMSKDKWMAVFEARMAQYKKLGITGIELNPFANAAWLESVVNTARRTDLILTFGSDSHGKSDETHHELGDIHSIAHESPLLIQGSMDQFLSHIHGLDVARRRFQLDHGVIC